MAQGHTENGITTVGLKCHVTIRYVMLVCFKKCPSKRGLPYEGVDRTTMFGEIKMFKKNDEIAQAVRPKSDHSNR